jgi:hypothetical protein
MQQRHVDFPRRHASHCCRMHKHKRIAESLCGSRHSAIGLPRRCLTTPAPMY